MILDGGKSIDVLIQEYKDLINFEDNMEKNNFKFVTQFVKRETKKNPNWEVDCNSFLKDVIEIHKLYLENRNFRI